MPMLSVLNGHIELHHEGGAWAMRATLTFNWETKSHIESVTVRPANLVVGCKNAFLVSFDSIIYYYCIVYIY